VSPLFEGLNAVFKWNFYTTLTINREASIFTTAQPTIITLYATIIMVGGSNAGRLGLSFDNIRKTAVDVTSSGWSLTPADINIIKGRLEA
jgi:hypothetical protein